MRIASKLKIDLSEVRDRKLISGAINGFTILDKGSGSFTLHIAFLSSEIDPMELTQNDVQNGDYYEWDIVNIRLSNIEQVGQTLKIIIEKEERGKQ